jgi:uncharacterized protein
LPRIDAVGESNPNSTPLGSPPRVRSSGGWYQRRSVRGRGGLEYLFGYASAKADGAVICTADWAFTRAAEKAAFERFVDFVTARLAQFPDLHIYHFAPYEPAAALKRLMGRYATREEEIDRLLRAKRFVDLYSVVRNGLRASLESDSIKKLEVLYGFARAVNLPDANLALAKIQAGLELGDHGLISAVEQSVVTECNRDDCLSTAALRDWLEAQRSSLIAQGTAIERPPTEEGAPSEAISAWQEKINALIAPLTLDVPADPLERTPAQHARWALAQILDWHRREEKALWWEHFRLAALAGDDLLDERAGLAGLKYVGTVGGTPKAPVHRYSFPSQETDLRGDEDLRYCGGEKLGKLQAISLDERCVDVKKRQDTAALHPAALYAHTIIETKILAESLVRLGEHAAANGIEGEGPYQAARDSLLRTAPRLSGQALRHPGEASLDAACESHRRCKAASFRFRDRREPGKTHTGARMICALVAAGRTVGITANSHKVIAALWRKR